MPSIETVLSIFLKRLNKNENVEDDPLASVSNARGMMTSLLCQFYPIDREFAVGIIDWIDDESTEKWELLADMAVIFSLSDGDCSNEILKMMQGHDIYIEGALARIALNNEQLVPEGS